MRKRTPYPKGPQVRKTRQVIVRYHVWSLGAKIKLFCILAGIRQEGHSSATRFFNRVHSTLVNERRGIPVDRLTHPFRKFSRLKDDELGGDTGMGRIRSHFGEDATNPMLLIWRDCAGYR